MGNADLIEHREQKALNHDTLSIYSRTNHILNKYKLLAGSENERKVKLEISNLISQANAEYNQKCMSGNKSTNLDEIFNLVSQTASQCMEVYNSEMQNTIKDLKEELKFLREDFITMEINYKNDLKRMKKEIRKLKHKGKVWKCTNATPKAFLKTSKSIRK